MSQRWAGTSSARARAARWGSRGLGHLYARGQRWVSRPPDPSLPERLPALRGYTTTRSTRRRTSSRSGAKAETHSHAAKSARLIQRLTESLWCSISPAMASGSHECQFPGCDSMTHGNGLPFALFSWGVAFVLKRVAATPPSRVTASARRRAGPARTWRPVAAAPAAARVDLLPAAGNPHICSGNPWFRGLRAVPLPSSGRTHLAVRVTVGDPPPHLFLA